jgi:protein-tyrosine phosphatase
MVHKVIQAIDLPTYKMSSHFEETFHFISNALNRGNVLVHCAAGDSRVGMEI